MNNCGVPRLSKWPFLLADVLLVGVAVAVVLRSSTPLTVRAGTVCLAATLAGAWFCVLPFLREHQASVKLSEADALASTVAQIGNLEVIKTEITNATGRWESVQQVSTQTVAAAKEIADRMKGELGDFCAFLQKAHDTEKNHLRLEVEKLRRGERDWLQAAVHVLDHIFALHTAGARSGQPALVAQLNQFQFACREAVRRLGLVSYAPSLHDPFDPQLHQLEGPEAKVEGSLRITEVLALGYSYQGELVRRALVRAQAEPEETPPSNPSA